MPCTNSITQQLCVRVRITLSPMEPNVACSIISVNCRTNGCPSPVCVSDPVGNPTSVQWDVFLPVAATITYTIGDDFSCTCTVTDLDCGA